MAFLNLYCISHITHEVYAKKKCVEFFISLSLDRIKLLATTVRNIFSSDAFSWSIPDDPVEDNPP